MAAAGKLRYVYLAFLAKPRADRQLYRLIKRQRITKIVELGVGSLERALNLVSICQRYSPDATITYTGLDWFEERSSDREPLSLIDMHRHLSAAGAAARLMPGGPVNALPTVANSVMGTDLVLISPDADNSSLLPNWFYVPRMLHEQSVVLRGEQEGDEEEVLWSPVERAKIDDLAKLAGGARAA